MADIRLHLVLVQSVDVDDSKKRVADALAEGRLMETGVLVVDDRLGGEFPHVLSQRGQALVQYSPVP